MNNRGKHICLSMSLAMDIIRYMMKASAVLERDKGNVSNLDLSRLLRKTANRLSATLKNQQQ